MATPKTITGLLKGPDDLPRGGSVAITLSTFCTIPGVSDVSNAPLIFEVPATGIFPPIARGLRTSRRVARRLLAWMTPKNSNNENVLSTGSKRFGRKSDAVARFASPRHGRSLRLSNFDPTRVVVCALEGRYSRPFRCCVRVVGTRSYSMPFYRESYKSPPQHPSLYRKPPRRVRKQRERGRIVPGEFRHQSTDVCLHGRQGGRYLGAT